jgi:thiol-disulfide isomerase/thioredoxin
MQSYHRLLIAVIAAVVATVALFQHFGTNDNASSESNAQNSQAAPAALYTTTFKTLENQEKSLKAWQDKIIVLNFWAPWCPPCLDEMPELSEFHDAYLKQNVVVIGLSVEDMEKTQAYFNEDKNRAVHYPILVGDLNAMDLSEKLGNSRGILPYTVLIDANGNIIKTFLGRVNRPLIEKSLLPILNIPKS